MRIYSYGCRLPTTNGDLVDQQILLAHRYYNKLIEIERNRRAKVRSIQAGAAPAIGENEAEVKRIDGEIVALLTTAKVKRAAERSAKVDVTAERAQIGALRKRRKECWEAVKAARAACKTESVVSQMRAASEEAFAEVRVARKSSGVYWGTYLTVEAAVEAAKKRPADPEFRRWGSGRGRVAVQIQNGIAAADAFGSDTRLQLDPPSQNRMSVVRIRVGSNDGGTPIFAAFPFRYHRDLPADGKIKWAWIARSTKGRWVNWDLQIVVEAESFTRQPRRVSDGGVVALGVGWRLRTEGDLRAGYWLDDQGQHGELAIPSDIKQRLEHADSLRAIQDRAFDSIKAKLLAWREGKELAPELTTALEFLPKWKSARRLGAVIDEWLAKGWPNQDILPTLEAWWKQHRHLYDWEQCERDRALGARREFYRRFAAQLTRRYAVVVLPDFDLREVAELPDAVSTREMLPQPARHLRQQAGVSELMGAVKVAAPGNGCFLAKKPCEFLTVACSRCGNIDRFDRRKLIKPECERCGGERGPVDQDLEFARNLLAAWTGEQGRSQTAAELAEIVGPATGALEMPAQGAVS